MTLPSTGELLQILGNEAISSGGTDTETDWTSDSTSGTQAMTFGISGFSLSSAEQTIGTSIAYRCVTGAHNNLGSTPTATVNHPSLKIK